MNLTLMRIADAILLFISFVGIPVIAGAIGFAAWNGLPKNFNRESYILGFLGLGFACGILILSAQRMTPEDIWHQLLQEVCGAIGLLSAGASGGCFIGMFVCRNSASSASSDD
jgi:hypothetical protein